MSPELLLAILTSGKLSHWAIVVLIILSLVQVSPIKVRPLSWIARKIGNALNSETKQAIEDIRSDVGNLKDDLSELKEDAKKHRAIEKRSQILRFGDEVLTDKKHTKEHFDEILDIITDYELYCKTHPNFKNNKTQMTVERIKEVYKDRLKKNDFLV